MDNAPTPSSCAADETKDGKSKFLTADRVWGRMANYDWPTRVIALLFVISAIVSMSFCQLGFWPIGIVDGKSVYLMLILAPLVMGALLFGPLMGALLGLLTGTVLFAHAAAFPLDFYEVYFMTPLNTFVLFTVLGAVSGWLFWRAFDNVRSATARTLLGIAACIILSFATSFLTMLNVVISYGGASSLDAIREYLFNSPRGVVLQAIVDATLVIVLCWTANIIVRLAQARDGERKLLSVFRDWMMLVSSIVFMVASAIIFSTTTATAQDEAEKAMASTVEYLENQLADNENVSFGRLVNGYKIDIDGYVVIVDRWGTILATNDDERYPIGGSLVDLLGYGEMYSDEPSTFFDEIIAEGETATLQAVGEDGAASMDPLFLSVGQFDDGYIAIARTPDSVYTNRFDTMLASTLLAIALIVSINILATLLLNRVVVRRIGETNDSLEKITDGNLNERVDIRDSREFASLSSGINTTVAALRNTIDEVKQRNAQELLTAKAIQENSLPTDFPAFPGIDRFDIYASMKTAKEVGGDFYDFFLIEDTSKVGFIMADVSGKGIPAALFMMTAKTQIRNHMEAGLPLNEAIDAANHQLCIGNDAGMFVTVWVGELDFETGQLEYVNGGHNPPLLLHDGTWEWMRDVSGMPLGLFDGIPYDLYTCQLQPGDMIYTYTDGVTEAMNLQGQLFSDQRLQDTLDKYVDFNPRSACVGVRRAITDFTLDCEQSDDITMLGLKYGVPPEEKAVMVLPARTDQLVHVCNYIHAELHRRHAPKSVYNPLDIAAEELFVNVCHYAYPESTPDDPGEARISFDYNPNPPSLTVQIVDDGVPYNPLSKPYAVTPVDIAEVPIGGLGILMAKKSVDEMTYERIGNSNVLTFVKGW